MNTATGMGMDTLQSLIGNYYGLDWLTLFVGLTASMLVTGGRLRTGFSLNIVSCLGGLSVAAMSGQNGFVVYNILLALINMRGILRGDRRHRAEGSVTPQDASAPAPAR